MITEPPIAFTSVETEEAGIDIVISFGVFAGRDATLAELDDLGRTVLGEVSRATVISEYRRELGLGGEASLHQIRIVVPLSAVPAEAEKHEWLRDRLIDVGGRWARTCIAHRHAEFVEL